MKLLASAKSSDGSSSGYSLEFTNIDQGYDDLLVKGWLRCNHAAGLVATLLQLGTSATGYSRGWKSHDGSPMSRQSDGSQRMTIESAGSGRAEWRDVFYECRIPRYADSGNYYKNSMNLSYSAEATTYGAIEGTATVQTNNKNALTSIQITMWGGVTMLSDSQWWLYGVKNS